MFYFKLQETIDELGITKNYLSVESKVRSNTIIDLAKGNAKRMELVSIHQILNTLNRISKDKGLDRIFDINDIIIYQIEDDED